jgi:tRNA(adenine34) deaminase
MAKWETTIRQVLDGMSCTLTRSDSVVLNSKDPQLEMEPSDIHYIRKCIVLANESVAAGDAPFGSLVVLNGEVIGKSVNNSIQKVSDHAEIIALHNAHQKVKSSNLTGATLYSNCEPCPMCAFMSREYKVSRVVYSVPSPCMGGHTKWNILEDEDLQHFPPYFESVPEIVGGVLEDEGREIFEKVGLWMFGTDARDRLSKQRHDS